MNQRQLFRLSYGRIEDADETVIPEYNVAAYYARDCLCMALETLTHSKVRREFHPCDEHEKIREEVSLSELYQKVTDTFGRLAV